MTVETTELEDFDVDELHLVKNGANGFPTLLLKAAKVDCPTCKGKGKVMDGNRDCPDCDATGKVTEDTADDLGKAAANDEYGTLVKAKYSADDLKTMADKGQAMKNDSGDPSYPIADEDDLDKAIKAVGRGNADHDAIRKHIIAQAAALKLSDKIPENWNADGSLAKADPGAGVPDDDGVPGSQSWETADAVRLSAATQSLLDLQCLLQTAAEREQIEGQTVDPDDLMQAWSLQDACYMLQNLLGVVAAMAVIEQREADKAGEMDAAKGELTKVGKRLSTKTIAEIAGMRDSLTAVLGEDDPSKTSSEEDDDAQKGADVLTDEDIDKITERVSARSATKAAADAEAERRAALSPGDLAAEDADKAEKEAAVKEAELEATAVAAAEKVSKSLETFTEQLGALAADLEIVKQMATPGGPVKTRQPADVAKADQRDIVEIEAASLEQKAFATEDADMRKGYLAKARELRQRVDA